MHPSTLNRRKLWSMSCETLFQNVVASVPVETLVKLCRRRQMSLPPEHHGRAAIYHEAHEHCHHDSPFSRHLQRYLNRKHSAAIAQAAQLQPDDLRDAVEALLAASRLTTLPETLPGLLWAVSSDSRESVRPIEKRLIDGLHWQSHCLLLAQFQGDVRVVGPEDAPSSAEQEALQQALEQRDAEQCALRQELQRYKRAENQSAKDNAQLQRQIGALQRRYEALQQQRQSPSSASTSPRDLKKLHYEIDKLTAAARDKDAEIQRLSAMLASDEAAAADEDSAGEPLGEPLRELPETAWPDIDLDGKVVVLIGGLAKASMHYEQAIGDLGGNCVRHEGGAHQGHKKLARMVRRADVVFCLVDCVSHGAAAAAKKLCRASEKPCYFLRSSGVSRIRDTLREVAQQG